MLETILNLATGGLAGTLLGGITSLVGTGLTKYAEYKQREQDIRALEIKNSHELLIEDKHQETMKLEWEGRNQVALTEGETQKEVADAKAFGDSFDLEPKQYSNKEDQGWFVKFLMGLLDFIRGSIRPGLTVYLCVLVSLIYWELQKFMETYGMTMSSSEIVNLSTLMISTFLYLFTTSYLWWFGTRNKQKPPKVL